MEEVRKLLDRKRVKLVENIDMKNKLLTLLISHGVLLSEHCDFIKAKDTPVKQIEEMLDILKRRSYNDFQQFIRVLQETQPHVAELLTENTNEANGKSLSTFRPVSHNGRSQELNSSEDVYDFRESYHKTQNEISMQQNEKFQNKHESEINQCLLKLETAEEQIKELTFKLEKKKELEEDYIQLTRDFKDAKAKCDSLNYSLVQCQKETEQLKKQLNSKEQKVSEMENLLQRKNEDIKMLQTKLCNLEERYPKFLNELDSKGSNIQVKGGGPIMGLAMLNMRIYFICLKSKKLYVFRDEPPYNQMFSEEFEIHGLKNPRDIVSTEKDKLLFISDEDDGEKHRIWQLSTVSVCPILSRSLSCSCNGPKESLLLKQQSLDVAENAEGLYKVNNCTIDRKPCKMFLCPVEDKQVGTMLAVLTSSFHVSCVEEYFVYIYKINGMKILRKVLLNSDLGEIFHVIIQPPPLKNSQSMNVNSMFESSDIEDPLSKSNFIVSHKTNDNNQFGETKTVWLISKVSWDGLSIIKSFSPSQVEGTNFNESEFIALADRCRILVADQKNDRVIILGPAFSGSQVLVKKNDRNRFEKPSRIFYHLKKRMLVVSHWEKKGTFSVLTH